MVLIQDYAGINQDIFYLFVILFDIIQSIFRILDCIKIEHSVTVAGNDTGFAMQTRRYLGNISLKIMAVNVVIKIGFILKLYEFT